MNLKLKLFHSHSLPVSHFNLLIDSEKGLRKKSQLLEFPAEMSSRICEDYVDQGKMSGLKLQPRKR